MKKLFLMIGLIMVVLILVSCQDDKTPTYTIDEVIEDIAIQYAIDDSSTHVTDHLSLPKKSNLEPTAKLEWSSMNPEVIDHGGNVLRQEEDTLVTLVLSVTLGSSSKQKLFEVNVIGTIVYYTVTFDVNDNETEVVIREGFRVTSPTEPQAEGYRFYGWYTDEAFENAFSFDTPITDDITIYASLLEILYGSYNVEIYYENIDDDEYTLIETTSGTDEEHTVVEIDLTFSGFEINTVLSTLSSALIANDTIVFKAYFDRLTYDLTWMSNDVEMLTQTLKFETPIIQIDDPIREFYTLIGWSLTEQDQTLYTFGDPIVEDQTLYAMWEANDYTITFNTTGGSTISPMTQAYLTTLDAPIAPTKDGYVFDGWYTDEALTNVFVFDTMPSSNMTLYAKWEIGTYTISFSSGGGSSILPVTQDFLTNIEEPAEPTKIGYTFVGWYTDLSYTTLFVFDTMPSQDTTVYANWDINTYTITFESNGGTSVDSITRDYNTSISRPANPTKEDFVFGGWYSNPELTTLFSFSNMPASDMTLYAKWNEPNSYTYEGYYEGADDLSGTTLESFLRNVVTTGFIGITYGEARYILDESDQDPNNPNNIILVYRGTSISGVWDAGDTWNREHVWPQSLLGVDVNNSTIDAGSDLHNLKPANPSENTSRSNDYFDDTGISGSYEPRDEVKGDVARILFYMTVRYDYLNLVNSTSPTLYQMAMLNTLLEWHILDPVDDFEMNRNNVIYSYQANRNPFIDHPEFVEMMWGPEPLSHSASLSRALTTTIIIHIDLYRVNHLEMKRDYIINLQA